MLASDVGLHSFMRRSDIQFRITNGESADVNEDQNNVWTNIFFQSFFRRINHKIADESGLFYKLLSEKLTPVTRFYLFVFVHTQ